MPRSAPLLLLLLLSLGLVACATPRGGGGDDDDSAGTDDDDDAATDDDDAVPTTETDCDDGVDEDEDGATDCADDDCSDVAPCFWPDALEHSGDFDFTGYEIECDIGFPIDIDVDDCRTTYSSTLGDGGGDCSSCDLTFAGGFTYSEDSCAELLDSTSPASGAFGVNFHSPTEWEFFAQNDSGAWESIGTTTDDGAGNHTITGTDVITGNPPDCGVDFDQELGSLLVTLTWRRPGT